MIELAFALLLAVPALRQDPKEARLAACNELVERVCAAFRSGELADLEACAALDPLFAQMTRGIDAPEDFRKGFLKGVRSSLLPTRLASVHEPLVHGGELKVLRVREAAERSLAGEPERLKAHWTLVAACLRLRDHDALLAALERMDALFELKWADFATIEQYKEFASSAQHARWLAYLAAKK